MEFLCCILNLRGNHAWSNLRLEATLATGYIFPTKWLTLTLVSKKARKNYKGNSHVMSLMQRLFSCLSFGHFTSRHRSRNDNFTTKRHTNTREKSAIDSYHSIIRGPSRSSPSCRLQFYPKPFTSLSIEMPCSCDTNRMLFMQRLHIKKSDKGESHCYEEAWETS